MCLSLSLSCCVRSHFYAVAVFELNVNAYFGVIACQSDAETRGLFCEAVAKEGIVGVCGNFYAIFVPHVIIPEAVVEMQVGVHNLCEFQIVFGYVAVEFLLLGAVEHSRVYGYGSLAFTVVYYESAYPERIKYELLYLQHLGT